MEESPASSVDLIYQSATFSLTKVHIQADEGLDIAAMALGDRLLIVLKGRLHCDVQRAAIELNPQQGLGITGRKRFNVFCQGLPTTFFLAEFYAPAPEDSFDSKIPSLMLFDFSERNAAKDLDRWATRSHIQGQISLRPLPTIRGYLLEQSSQILVLLSGSFSLNGDRTLQGGEHCLLGTGTFCTLETKVQGKHLCFGLPQPVFHQSCGSRAPQNSLASSWGDGEALVSQGGQLQGANLEFFTLLNLDSSAIPMGSAFVGLLDVSMKQWLLNALRSNDLAQTHQHISKGSGLQVKLLPFSTSKEESSFLLSLRSTGNMPQNITVPQSKGQALLSIAPLRRAHSALVGNRKWVLLWGGDPQDREVYGNNLIYHGESTAKHLTITPPIAQQLERILLYGAPGHLDLRLHNLKNQTLFIHGLENIDKTSQSDVFKLLCKLAEHPDAHWLRIIVLMNTRPSSGLPAGHSLNGLLIKGPFTVVTMPSLNQYLLRLFETLLRQKRPTRKPVLDKAAKAWLRENQWCPSYGELENVVDDVMEQSRAFPVGLEELKEHIPQVQESEKSLPTLHEAEKQLLAQAMVAARGNKAKAAQLLGITRTRLYRKLAEHQLGQGLSYENYQ